MNNVLVNEKKECRYEPPFFSEKSVRRRDENIFRMNALPQIKSTFTPLPDRYVEAEKWGTSVYINFNECLMKNIMSV